MNLGHPHSLVFDETFYVKDAYTTLRNGYESSWPADADEAFNAGDTAASPDRGRSPCIRPSASGSSPSGLAVFGADYERRLAHLGRGLRHPAVLLTTLVAKKLFRSTLLATVAGFLIAIDGHAIVMSRVALLDGIFALIACAGVGAVLHRSGVARDRPPRHEDHGAGEARPGAPAGALRSGGGRGCWPRPSVRPGVERQMVGPVLSRGLRRVSRRRRRPRTASRGPPVLGGGAILKQGPVTFLLTVPIAIVVYLSTWSGWFLTSGGMYRQWVQSSGEYWTGPLAWVPNWAQNFWHLEAAVYNYHVNEHTPHPYQANPLTWLFLIRPTADVHRHDRERPGRLRRRHLLREHHVDRQPHHLVGRHGRDALPRLPSHPQARVGRRLILMGMVAGYLPWLLYINRTIYQFYTIAFEPYLILGLVFVIGLALGRRSDPRWMRCAACARSSRSSSSAPRSAPSSIPSGRRSPFPGWFSRCTTGCPRGGEGEPARLAARHGGAGSPRSPPFCVHLALPAVPLLTAAVALGMIVAQIPALRSLLDGRLKPGLSLRRGACCASASCCSGSSSASSTSPGSAWSPSSPSCWSSCSPSASRCCSAACSVCPAASRCSSPRDSRSAAHPPSGP